MNILDNEYRNALKQEVREIADAIQPFFSPDKWLEFLYAAPGHLVGFHAYLRAEWQRIYDEFTVTT